MKKILTLSLLTVVALCLAGCLISRKQVVTTNALTGIGVTNTVISVNPAALAADCGALRLVGTPLLTYSVKKYPQIRPIVVDVRTALKGAINGADTNITATIHGFIGKDPTLDAQLDPLIQAASDLRGQLIEKYCSGVGDPATKAQIVGQISIAILQTDLDICNSALAAP